LGITHDTVFSSGTSRLGTLTPGALDGGKSRKSVRQCSGVTSQRT